MPESNREKRRTYQEKYRQEHKKQIRACNKKYYQEHREQIIAYRKKYREEHKEELNLYARKYRLEHRKERSTWEREYRKNRKLKIFRLLGNKCVHHQKNFGCECSDIRCLQIDHVNSGGSKERRHLGSEGCLNHILDEVRKGSKEYQLLCANCNWIKRYENGE